MGGTHDAYLGAYGFASTGSPAAPSSPGCCLIWEVYEVVIRPDMCGDLRAAKVTARAAAATLGGFESVLVKSAWQHQHGPFSETSQPNNSKLSDHGGGGRGEGLRPSLGLLLHELNFSGGFGSSSHIASFNPRLDAEAPYEAAGGSSRIPRRRQGAIVSTHFKAGEAYESSWLGPAYDLQDCQGNARILADAARTAAADMRL